MRFSAVLVSLVAATGFVAAQSSSSTSTSVVPVATTSYDKVTAACLDGCDEEDVNCRAACFGNPHPDEDAANATTQCSMKCVQGDGTEAETAAYAACQKACVDKHFLTTTGGTPAATSGSSTKPSGSKGSDAASSDKDDSEKTDEEKKADADSEEANADDKDSGAGKLAMSAGGAIALAFVALAL